MVSNDDISDGVMIALLPTSSDWCRIDLPHLTLVYAGLTSDLKATDFSELAKDAAMLAMISTPLNLKVTGRETFGPLQDTDVLTLMATPELLAMRRAVERWNKSEFPFDPHVTIGPVGTLIDVIPNTITFDRIMVAWGTDQMTWWLKPV